jgi:hypothetical protein
MNDGNLIPCTRPTVATSAGGLSVAVDYWLLETVGSLVGYGLLDGKMKRLDPCEFRYDEATGEVKSVVSVDETGVASVAVVRDGRLVCTLRIAGDTKFTGGAVVS